MSEGRASRWGRPNPLRRRFVRRAVVVLGVAFVFAADATAAGHKFPVPTCKWTPTSLIGRTVGVSVRGLKGKWNTDVAPVLTCGFLESQPELQFGNVDLVTVQFRELQRFKPPKNWTFVKGLGSCVEHSSCPVPGKPAWLFVNRELAQPPPYGHPFIDVLVLRVEDGLNSLTIAVDNPNGPLPVRNEVANIEGLARKLLPLFYWK